MKTKQTFLAVFLLLFSCTLFAQTKIIAHKSHSGKPSTFNVFSAHNFGITPIIITDTVIRVTDSIFVAVMHEEFSKSTWRDTVSYNEQTKNYYSRHYYFGKSLEVLQAEMPNTVFIGFEEDSQLPPQMHYFYPHNPNANPDYFRLPPPQKNTNDQTPVKKY
ncbi:MAG: hypothetical protein R3E32_22480 [Chitinophagales bacterium]